jgi:hypothetical protein
MKKDVLLKSFSNLHVYVAKVNKHSLRKLGWQVIFNLKLFQMHSLWAKKLPLSASCTFNHVSTEMKLSLGAFMNLGDYFDTSDIKIRS